MTSRARALHQSVFKTDDYRDLRVYVGFLYNLTSRTEVGGADALSLLEVSKQGLSLRAPRTACSIGHRMEGGLVRSDEFGRLKSLPRKNWGNEANVTFTAKVTGIEKIDGKNVAVQLTFQQIDESDWSRILGDLRGAQANAFALFKRIKG